MPRCRRRSAPKTERRFALGAQRFLERPYEAGMAAPAHKLAPEVLELVPPAPRVLWRCAFVLVVVEMAGKIFNDAALQAAQEVVGKTGHFGRREALGFQKFAQ